MIAIVYKNEAAILYISPEMIPFLRRKLNELVAAQIAKRTFKNLDIRQLKLTAK